MDEASDPQLAERWRTAAASGDPAQLPSDLRRAVLNAVAGNGSTRDLLDPPTYGEIQQALGALDADVLVYLVPGTEVLTGYAVCAPAEGAPRHVPLPNLTIDSDDITHYFRAVSRQDRSAVPAPDSMPPEAALQDPVLPEPDGSGAAARNRELGASADAARAAVAAAVDRRVRVGVGRRDGPAGREPAPPPGSTAARRPHRLVLVPMGDLARVPWQAARRPADRRYADRARRDLPGRVARACCCRSADAAARPAVPRRPGAWPTPTPGPARPAGRARGRRWRSGRSSIPAPATSAARPDGTTSPSGRGTTAEVRRLAHGRRWPERAACCTWPVTAFVDVEDAKPAAYLVLADGEKLFAEELVALLAQSPDRVGLAVLAACHSGVAMTGYDEAYSLGTAFLAGGVRSVLCTQWAVPDEETSVLMFMVHHFVHSTGLPAWAALRQAQRWMLDPDRDVPADMPTPLRSVLDPEKLADVVGVGRVRPLGPVMARRHVREDDR